MVKNLVIYGGFVYEIQEGQIEEDGEVRFFSGFLGDMYKRCDVITQLEAEQEQQLFLPSYSGGHVIIFRKEKEETTICLEFEPSRRLTRFDRDLYAKMQAVLAYPYVYLFIKIRRGMTSIYPYYRNTPVTTPEDHLCYTNLFNTSKGHRCADLYFAEKQPTLHGKIGLAVHAFWENENNLEWLWENTQELNLPGHPKTIFAWERRSRFPNWKRYITSIPWPDTGLGITEIAEFVSADRPKPDIFDVTMVGLKDEGKIYYADEEWLE